jgi:hypothetical protein
VVASATPPPVDGPHWKPVAKVIETFHARWGILAADKFNAQPWWYRWSTASGWPRRLVHKVYPPETRIDFDSDELDPDRDDEIEIRLNGEACMGWLAVWDPPEPAALSTPSPRKRAKRAKRAQKHAGGREPEYEWEIAARYVDRVVANHGLLPRNKKTSEPVKARAVGLMLQGFRDSEKAVPRWGRTVEKWITANWQRCRHWWGLN